MNNILAYLAEPEHAWLQLLAVALAIVIGSQILHWFAGIVGARATERRPFLRAIFERTRAPLHYAVPLLALSLVWASAPDTLPRIVVVRQWTAVLLIAALTWAVVRTINAVGEGIGALYPVDVSDNLFARRVQTQTRVLARAVATLALLLGGAAILMTFPSVRQIGASLLASAGLAGLVVGFAAKPVLGNLLAGLQIAITQPIRIDDVVIVEGEWGRIQEINGSYVVVKIWDERRLIVPLQWFIEHPFQNWTRTGSQITGSVFWWLDYRMPLAPLRAELERVCRAAPDWDGRFFNLQVTDTTDRTMQVRALMTSADASRNFNLRCSVREAIVDFVQREYPDYLPRMRAHIDVAGGTENALPNGVSAGRKADVTSAGVTPKRTATIGPADSVSGFQRSRE